MSRLQDNTGRTGILANCLPSCDVSELEKILKLLNTPMNIIKDYGCCGTDFCNTANIMTPYGSSNNGGTGSAGNSTNSANQKAFNNQLHLNSFSLFLFNFFLGILYFWLK